MFQNWRLIKAELVNHLVISQDVRIVFDFEDEVSPLVKVRKLLEVALR